MSKPQEPKRLSVVVPPHYYKAMQATAKEDGVTISIVIRQGLALRCGIKKGGKA